MLETDMIKIVAWKGSQSVLYNPTEVDTDVYEGARCAYDSSRIANRRRHWKPFENPNPFQWVFRLNLANGLNRVIKTVANLNYYSPMV